MWQEVMPAEFLKEIEHSGSGTGFSF
jgi:hypothetical protein